MSEMCSKAKRCKQLFKLWKHYLKLATKYSDLLIKELEVKL